MKRIYTMQNQQWRFVLAVSLIIWLMSTNICQAASTNLPNRQNLLMDTVQHKVIGLAVLDLTQIPIASETASRARGKAAKEAVPVSWVLARVVAGPESGGTTNGIQIGTNGPFVAGDAILLIRWRGTFQTTATFTTTGPTRLYPAASRTYLFTVPWFFINHVSAGSYAGEDELNPSAMMERYALFASGGLVLFQISGDPGNTDSLTAPPELPLYLIPDAWEKDLGPAWQVLHAYAALFQPKNAALNQDALRKKLNDPNPFVAVAACRTLAQANLFTLPQMRTLLAAARGDRQAAFLFLLVHGPEDGTMHQKLTMLSGLISSTNDADALTGLLAGLYAVSAERVHTYRFDVNATEKAAAQIRQRLLALGGLKQADPTTAALLQSIRTPS